MSWAGYPLPTSPEVAAYLRSIYPNSGLNGPRSGYRTAAENAAVSGAADSRHMMPGGHAVDVHGIPTFRQFKTSLNALGLPNTWAKNETATDPGTGPHYHGQWGEFQPAEEQRWFPTPAQYAAFGGNQAPNFSDLASQSKFSPSVTVAYEGPGTNTQIAATSDPAASPNPASLTTISPTGLFGGGLAASRTGGADAGQSYGALTAPTAFTGSYNGPDPSLPSLNFPGSGTYSAETAGNIEQAPHTSGGGWGPNDYKNAGLGLAGVFAPPGIGILGSALKAATNSDAYNTNHLSMLADITHGPGLGERAYDWIKGLLGGYNSNAPEGNPATDQIMNSPALGISPGLFGAQAPMSIMPAFRATDAPGQVDFSRLGQLPSLNFPGSGTYGTSNIFQTGSGYNMAGDYGSLFNSPQDPPPGFSNQDSFSIGLNGVATLPGQQNNGLI